MISPTPPPPPPQTRYYDGKLLKLRMEPSNENYSSVNDGEGHQRITTRHKPPMVHPHHHHHSSYQSFSSNSRYRPYPRMRYNVYPSPAAPSQMLSTLNGRISSSKKAPRNSTMSNPSAPCCPGCLCGNNNDDASSSRRMHMKLLHIIMSRVVYSNDDDNDNDILAKQRPGAAICYDGLIFLFEGKPTRLVVRSENCTGQPWCPPCHEQRERVACMLKDVMEESNSDELERIKFVPSLAEAQIQKLRAELEDYKANGVVVVPV